jgi:hypothetical protein
LLLASLCLLVSALWRPALATDEGGEVIFDVRTASGATFSGTLREIGADWSIRLNGTKQARLKPGEVISLRRQAKRLPGPSSHGQVLLSNGSRVLGDLLEITDDRLLFSPAPPIETEKDLPWSIPLTAVSVVWLAPPDRTEQPELLLRRLAQQERTQDSLLRKNGDKVQGTLKRLKDQTFRIEVKGNKIVEVSKDKVAALAFNTELVSRARPKGIYAHLVVAKGCRLEITAARIQGGGKTLWGKLPSGGTFTVALDQVAALDYRQGCATYLSDLKHKAYRHTPFLGESWPYVADGSVANHPLRLGGSTYDKGLGLHSQSRLTYALPNGSRFFEALVGFDDATGRKGRARIRVLVDGKPVAVGREKELTARDKPLAIRVDVSKGRELTLVVDFGSRGDVQAHVNWVDARVIK